VESLRGSFWVAVKVWLRGLPVGSLTLYCLWTSLRLSIPYLYTVYLAFLAEKPYICF
jgi:hypothetical protein